MVSQDLKNQLNGLIRGLWFPSEAEAPWTMPTWTLETVEPQSIRRVLRRHDDPPIVEISLEALLAQVDQRCRGYGDEGRAIAQQHHALAKFLQDHCQRVQVFRVGQVTVDILIVSQTPHKNWMLQTQSVET